MRESGRGATYEEHQPGLRVQVPLYSDPIALDGVLLDGRGWLAHAADREVWRNDAGLHGDLGDWSGLSYML
jgi:hypothetical protein